MMTYDEFEKYMNTIKNNYRFTNAIWEIFEHYGGECNIPDCMNETIKLLSIIMNDEDEWIGYFCYELDFGDSWEAGLIKDKDGNDIKLQNIRDLYDFLTNRKE